MKKQLLSLLLCLIFILSNSIPVMATEPTQIMQMPAEEVENSQTDTSQIMQAGDVYVNPLYAETQTAEELNQPSGIIQLSEKEYVTDETAIAEAIRDAMTLREADIFVNFQSEIAWDETQVRQWIKDWMEEALEETDNPEQGDSLRWVYGGYSWSVSGSYSGNTYYYDYSIAMTYYTTREQEIELTGKVNELLDSFAFSGNTSDYIKIKTIYDYICDNITYDYENLENDDYKLKYTAYAALVNGTAVCQGYAVLLYRMLEEVGIDSRVISGIGNGGAHGWNIALLKGFYYNLDSTWDAGRSEYGYFLKCMDTFDDHTRNEQYASDTFMETYLMGPVDYVVQEEDISSGKETVITSQPEDFTGQVGEKAIFIVKAAGEGLSYQWQYQNAGTMEWKISGQAGNRTSSLSVLITEARNGQKYRCIITDEEGNQVISDSAAIYITPPDESIGIAIQPEDYTGKVGEIAVFTVEATGEGLTYQWQYQIAGKNEWKNSGQNGNRTSGISVSITEARDGQKYRCVITNAAGDKAVTNTAALHVEISMDDPAIINQPADYTGTLGETAIFTINATGNDIYYQWQYQNVGTAAWKVSIQAGNKTNSLKVPITEARNGQKYRCIVTDRSGNQVISDEVTLHVGDLISNVIITGQPNDYTGKVGETAVFIVEAEGEELTYQWQYQNVGTSVWKASVQTGSKTSSVRIPITETRNGQKYRCLVMNASGDTAVSNAVILNVEE